MKRYIILSLVLIAMHIGSRTKAQQVGALRIDYATYIKLVGKNNLAYSAQKFNVPIADANILNASIFPDPELQFGWADNGQRRMKMGYGFSSGISWTLEMGAKRKARMDLAKNEAQLSKLLLEDYFRNLRADATLAYLLAIQNQYLLEVQTSSYQQMKKMAEADSVRFKLGAITHIDARQSKLEAGTLLNEVFAAEAEWKTSLTDLSLFGGDKQLWQPTGALSGFDRNYSLQELVMKGQSERTDLKMAMQSKAVSTSTLKLAMANRAIDIGLSLGMNYNSYVSNIIAPTPSMTTVNAGISIPLKFSNNRLGEIKGAQYGVLQAEQAYKHTELAIQTEITQAFYSYQAAQKQVQQFNNGLIQEARAILDGKIYSYQRGEVSLLEVLTAQRTYNEVQQNYYKALYNYGATLVVLEKAAGIWDINF